LSGDAGPGRRGHRGGWPEPRALQSRGCSRAEGAAEPRVLQRRTCSKAEGAAEPNVLQSRGCCGAEGALDSSPLESRGGSRAEGAQEQAGAAEPSALQSRGCSRAERAPEPKLSVVDLERATEHAIHDAMNKSRSPRAVWALKHAPATADPELRLL
jgi:hypothetical protein